MLSSKRKRYPIAVDKTIYTAAMALFVAFWIFPMFLTLITSVKTDTEFLKGPFALPQNPTLRAFGQVWQDLDFQQLLLNSFIYATGGTALAIFLAIFPAYALSRFRIPGDRVIFIILLTGMMLPQQTVIIPLYDVLREINLLNSRLGLIVVHAVYGLPLQLLILRGFMVGIPVELESAARVDGCSDFGVLRHIILPLAAPAVAVGFTLNFINIWKEFFFALVFLNSPQVLPVTIGILQLTSHRYFTSWNLPAAGLVLAQLPTVLLFIFAYRWITQGIYAGSVKG